MEDEEYLPENSDLRIYLESLNLCDDHRDNTVKQKPSKLPLSVGKATKNSVESIDKDVIEQIEELLAARLLFEEDISNIERLLSNFKVVQVGMLRSIFENVSGFIVIVLGLCVYWIIGSYVFFMISVYYAYNAADYLWKKHFSQKRLKYLRETLQENFTLFRKTLKFIKDSDEIFKTGVQNKENSEVLGSRYQMYFNLKRDFTEAENEVIQILTKATKKLIDIFPFYDYVEQPHYYLCYRYENHILDCVDLTKLYQIYLLVQSEFLQRLALTLIPNIKISGKENCVELYKIIKETSVHMKRLENKFSKKFKFVFLRGIYEPDRNYTFNPGRRVNSSSKCLYKNELITNIQDMSNTFQRLLIRSRNLENSFPNEDEAEQMENELTDIQKELSICQRNICDSFIVLKKFSNKKDDVKDNDLKPFTAATKKVDIEPIDLTAEENSVDYEIFEAHFMNSDEPKVEDDYDFDDYMKKKLEREYSKIVLQELKSKIAEKAKVREMREANALVKKFDEPGCISEDNDKMVNNLTPKELKINENETCNPVLADKSNLEPISSSSDEDSEKMQYQHFQLPNSDFMAEILKARSNVVKSSVIEDCYCDSEEEMEEYE